MNLEHYNKVSFSLNKYITNAYSTSFSLGIKAFSPEYREPIYGLYGFVRIADEIVDSFHGYDKKELFENFRKDTFKAIHDKISTNPVLNAFQKVVNQYQIDLELIESFLDSMEMDLYESSFQREDYDTYVFGSAEAVGLMCLRIFTKNNPEQYTTLRESARALGSAFQKVNFLRDIKSDLDERGRIYLPNVHSTNQINDQNKKLLENEIEKEFSEALEGIKKLPMGVQLGVYLAYVYYTTLFRKIKLADSKKLLRERIRVSDIHKVGLFVKSFWETRVLNLHSING